MNIPQKAAIYPHSARSALSPSGFTLIELLTVIAIIGILAAILIPVVGRVRESARRATCASNLRQIDFSITLYAQEQNNGNYPDMSYPSTSLYHLNVEAKKALMQDYNMPRDIFYCPSNWEWNRDDFWEGGWTGNSEFVGISPIGYVLIAGNRRIYAPFPQRDYPMSLDRESERREVAACMVARYQGDFERRTGHTENGQPAGTNVLHTGGRVEWKPFSELTIRDPGAYTLYW